MEPGKQYQLQVRAKGTAVGRAQIGVCTDTLGNQDYGYVKLPDALQEWTTLTLDFRGDSTGRQRVIFRNSNTIGELLIGQVTVVEAQ